MLNDFQQTLFDDLMRVCDEVDLFYFKDHTHDGTVYRAFSYHIGSYTDFCRPNALECRGAMFEMYGGVPVRLAALPLPKFFNYNEVSSDLNTLCEALVRNGRLSQDVYEKLKKENKGTTSSS